MFCNFFQLLFNYKSHHQEVFAYSVTFILSQKALQILLHSIKLGLLFKGF